MALFFAGDTIVSALVGGLLEDFSFAWLHKIYGIQKLGVHEQTDDGMEN